MISLITILITTIIVSFVAFQKPHFLLRLAFIPYRIHRYGEVYRFLTYGFIHADFVHLFVNMFVLYSFGSVLIQMADFIFGFGLLFFTILYFSSLIFSTVLTFFRYKNNYHYIALGASGAVSAIVFASILLYPTGTIRIFLLPIDIPAWIFGLFYVIYSAVMAKHGGDNVGHDVHFAGAIYGFIFPLFFQPSLLQRFVWLITQ